MKTVDEYKKDIIRALKATERYSKALDLQIVSLAGAMRSLALANADIDALDTTVVLEETRYGKKYAPHPAFKVQRDAQGSVTRQMKALGLTASDLQGENETDPLIALTDKVRNAGRKTTTIRPTDDR